LRWLGIVLRRADIVPLEEKRVIEERLSMYDDLMEKDPKMIRIRAESEARGEARGEAKGETKGRTQELRMTIVAFVQVRFPTLVELANQKVKHLSTPDELRLLFQQLLHAADEDVARSLLTTSAG
jgi:predicted transposase YdaD